MDTHGFKFVSLLLRRATRLLLAAFVLHCYSLVVTQAEDFIVPGTSGHNWVDTGLDIAPCSILQFSATGGGRCGIWLGFLGAGRDEAIRRRTRLSSGDTPSLWAVASLTVGRSSPGDGEIWSYGETQQHCAEQGGHLWLTVNDDNADNNTGAFMVDVAPAGRLVPARQSVGGSVSP